jgi:hypothetical protein
MSNPSTDIPTTHSNSSTIHHQHNNSTYSADHKIDLTENSGIDFSMTDNQLANWARDVTQFDSSTWEIVVEDKHKYTLWKKKEESSDVYMVRAIVNISANLNTVFEALHNTEQRKSWDQSFLEMQIKSKFQGNDDLLYSAIKAPFPMANRDSLQHRSYRLNKDNFIYVYKCMVHTLQPERKGFVRTESMGCFYGEHNKDNNGDNSSDNSTQGTKLHLMMRSDPRGSIPTMVINTVAPLLARKWIERLVAHCEKQQQQ